MQVFRPRQLSATQLVLGFCICERLALDGVLDLRQGLARNHSLPGLHREMVDLAGDPKRHAGKVGGHHPAVKYSLPLVDGAAHHIRRNDQPGRRRHSLRLTGHQQHTACAQEQGQLLDPAIYR